MKTKGVSGEEEECQGMEEGVARELMSQKGMSSGWQGNERNHPLGRQETPMAEPAVSQELDCSCGEERKDR
jgi:hypothetical protein